MLKQNDKKCSSLHLSMRKLKRAHTHILKEEFNKINLTDGKPKILNILKNNPGCSQRELANNCRIEPATATSILSSMEKEGLVVRERNNKDKRILNVNLTEEGIEVQKKVSEIFDKVDEKCFIGFSKEEQKQALDFLERIYENLKNK